MTYKLGVNTEVGNKILLNIGSWEKVIKKDEDGVVTVYQLLGSFKK